MLSAARGVPLYGPSGASAHVRGVVRGFQALGWDVTVAVTRLVDHRGAVEDLLDCEVVLAEPLWPSWISRGWRERGERWLSRRVATKAIRRVRADLIWERHALFADGGARVAADKGIRRIVELNAPLALERAMYEDLRNADLAERLEKDTLRTAHRVVAVSDWLAKWAVAAAKCTPGQVRHVMNGVDDHGPGDRDGMRARLGLDGLVLGFLGTLKPWHGIERLVPLIEAVPEATLVVAGDGPVPVPAHPRIRALGRVPPAAVPHVVAAMDVGLAPYPAEAPAWFCPLKLAEYRAQGVPFVAADVGDCGRLAEDGAGEVVETDDVGVWAAAIRRQATAPRVRRVRSWRDVIAEALRD